MPLRDFERVRERIELHLEVRHVAQFALACLILLAAAFGAGYQVALSTLPATHSVPAAQPQDGLAIAPLPAPTPTMRASAPPVLPRPMPVDRRQPRMARVLESIARSERVATATAAGRQEARVQSELHESPLDHVAASHSDDADPRVALVRREQAEARPGARPHGDSDSPEGDSPTPGTLVVGQSVDARPDSDDGPQGEPLPPLDPIKPEFVQSLPPVPLEAALTVDSTAIGQTRPVDIGAALPVDDDGAIRVSQVEAGGQSVDQPLQTPAQIDHQAVRAFFDRLAQQEQARIEAEKAEAERIEQARVAEAQAALARAAAEKAEAERAAQAQAEARRAALAEAQAERVALAKAKAERLAQQKAEALEAARQKAQARKERQLAAASAKQTLSLKKPAALARGSGKGNVEAGKVEAGKVVAGKVEAGNVEAGNVEAGNVEAGKPATDRERLAAMEAERVRLMAARAARGDTTRPAQEPIADDTSAPPKGAPRRYYVQIKAFQNDSEARLFGALLRKQGYKPTLSRTVVPGKGTFYRVRLGPYATQERAKAQQERFEAKEPYETMVMWR